MRQKTKIEQDERLGEGKRGEVATILNKVGSIGLFGKLTFELKFEIKGV